MPPKAPPVATAKAVAAAPTKDERPEGDGNTGLVPPEDENVTKHGEFSFTDGSKYTGEYRMLAGGTKPERHGHGVYLNGPEKYKGTWEHDQMHGHGVYHFATGAFYEGEFQANVFHGTGRYQWADGAFYTGGWSHGRMHDESGRYVDKDGVEWRGRFFNGKYDNGRIFHTLR